MKIIRPAQIQPNVRLANYFQTAIAARWGMRTIPDLELIYVVSGRFSYKIPAADAIIVEPNEVLCIPPLQKHIFRRIDNTKKAVISCIHSEMLPQGSWAKKDYRLDPEPQLITDVRDDRNIRELFKRCNDVFCGLNRYRTALLETIVREIWIRLAEHWISGTNPSLSRRMEKMIDYLREHLLEPVSRQDLADEFGITPEHVNALFKHELGISPTQLIHRERVLLAYRYIHYEGLSVKQAAAKVGFCDPFYFSKVFKKIMGTSPSRT